MTSRSTRFFGSLLSIVAGAVPAGRAQQAPAELAAPAPGVRARLVPDQPRAGRLERGDLALTIEGRVIPGQVQDEWIFTGVFGDTVTLEVRSTAIDAHVRVLDPERLLLGEDYTLDERRTSWRVTVGIPTTQEYVAVVSGGLGPYRITLRRSARGSP